MTEKKAPDLLPCPFCGEGAGIRDDSYHSSAVYIGCATPGCYGDNIWEETQNEAITAWNTRSDARLAAVGMTETKAPHEIMADTEARHGNRDALEAMTRELIAARKTIKDAYALARERRTPLVQAVLERHIIEYEKATK